MRVTAPLPKQTPREHLDALQSVRYPRMPAATRDALQSLFTRGELTEIDQMLAIAQTELLSAAANLKKNNPLSTGVLRFNEMASRAADFRERIEDSTKEDAS